MVIPVHPDVWYVVWWIYFIQISYGRSLPHPNQIRGLSMTSRLGRATGKGYSWQSWLRVVLLIVLYQISWRVRSLWSVVTSTRAGFTCTCLMRWLCCSRGSSCGSTLGWVTHSLARCWSTTSLLKFSPFKPSSLARWVPRVLTVNHFQNCGVWKICLNCRIYNVL